MRHGLSRARVPLVLGVILVGVALAAIAGASVVSGSHSPSGRHILNETQQRYATATSVVGTADVAIQNDTMNRSARVEYAIAGNNSRVIVHANGSSYRLGTNGTVSWYADANQTRVWPATDAPPRSSHRRQTVRGHLQAIQAAAENATVTLNATTTINGTRAYVIQITPSNATTAAHGRVTVWVAHHDHRLLRMRATDGVNRTVVSFPSTRFNVSIDRSTFQPPTNRTVVTGTTSYQSFTSLQGNTTLSLFHLNATFDSGRIVRRQAGIVVAQRYESNGRNVSVVSTTATKLAHQWVTRANATRATVDGCNVSVGSVRGSTVAYWSNGSVDTAVVTKTTPRRTAQIACHLATQQ